MPKSETGRVKVTVPTSVSGADADIELPFSLAVLADLAGDNAKNRVAVHERTPKRVRQSTLGDFMKEEIKPTLSLEVDNRLSEEEGTFGVELAFQSMKDFRPESLVDAIPELASLRQQRDMLKSLRSRLSSMHELRHALEASLKDDSFLEEASRLRPTAEEGDQ